jgi:hypothetical protein
VERSPEEAVLPPLRGALPPSLETARSPVLVPSPRLRPDCSLDRRGASNDDHADGVDEEPIEEPTELLPLDVLPPLLLEPLSPPRGVADPPPSPPPRGADEPVVLPFDERSCPAAGSPVKPVMANATASVLTNLCFITPPADVCGRTLAVEEATGLPVEPRWIWALSIILR